MKKNVATLVARKRKMGCHKLHIKQNKALVKGALGLYISYKKGCAGAYRYGFNGQEKVDEIAGVGNHNTALFWEYDTRLGRRWNVDPVDQVSVSNYAVMYCNPIVLSDVMGDSPQKRDKSNDYGWRFKNSKLHNWLSGLFKTKSSPMEMHAMNTTGGGGKGKAYNSGDSKFSYASFMTDLNARKNNPSGVDQGGSDGCWAAVIIKQAWIRDPAGMESAMINYYNTGTFNYKNVNITPCAKAMAAVGGSLQETETDGHKMTNIVDQMLFIAMMESYQGRINFDQCYNSGDQLNPIYAGRDFAAAVSAWQDFGFNVCSNGNDFINPAFGKIRKINSSLIAKNQSIIMYAGFSYVFIGSHFIEVESLTKKGRHWELTWWDYGGSGGEQRKKNINWFTGYFMIHGIITIPK